MHPSVRTLWCAYLRSIGEEPDRTDKTFNVWHFCDMPAEADALADLVMRGIKRATTPSVWELEARDEPMPQPGNLYVITNWDGIAQCIIRTTQVAVKPFNQVGADYARIEGEGDRTLAYWRRTHWAYYERVLRDTDYAPHPEMPVVCEQFEVVFIPGGTTAFP